MIYEAPSAVAEWYPDAVDSSKWESEIDPDIDAG